MCDAALTLQTSWRGYRERSKYQRIRSAGQRTSLCQLYLAVFRKQKSPPDYSVATQQYGRVYYICVCQIQTNVSLTYFNFYLYKCCYWVQLHCLSNAYTCTKNDFGLAIKVSYSTEEFSHGPHSCSNISVYLLLFFVFVELNLTSRPVQVEPKLVLSWDANYIFLVLIFVNACCMYV